MSQINMIRGVSRALVGAVRQRAPRADTTLTSPVGAPSRAMASKAVNIDNINPNIVKLQYAVRGPLVIRAGEIEKELEKGAQKPFKRVIRANIGDAHAMGQQPITFIRQVLSCLSHPPLIESSDFPADVKQRAKEILDAVGGNSIGVYSASHGIELIRRRVAEYITRRDGGLPARWEDVCLSAGASTAIKNCLQLFCNKVDGKDTGVMIPIPQYPLYSASLAEYGLGQIGYYLDEDKNWGLDVNELERALAAAADHAVRAIVVINPGNPTGQVLTRENIEEVIKFAHRHKLFIFADEVYQHNVYAEGSAFYSFKKVLHELGEPYSRTELASFMSASKGYMGECGLRGGWMELVNIEPEVQTNLYKCISAMLCPTTLGQAAIDCIARPPQPGEPSHAQFARERDAVLRSLKERAAMVVDTFNHMPGFSCNVVQGAMYAFPRIELPPKAIAAAAAAGQQPDVFYAFNLLEETGICVIPGSGFGQRPGTFHFRTTILPQPAMLKEMLDIFQDFHAKFTQKYS